MKSKPRYPLAAAQRTFWATHMAESVRTSAANNLIVFGRRFAERSLDYADRIKHAVASVVAQHDGLRTTYEQQDGRWTQVVQDSLPPYVAFVDLSALSAYASYKELQSIESLEGAYKFDIRTESPLRWTVVEVSPGDYVHIVNAHHLVVDWSSFRILLMQVAMLTGSPDEPAPVPALQYGEACAWMERQLASESRAGDRVYWTRELSDPGKASRLAVDRETLGASSQAAQCDYTIGAGRLAGLLAKAEGVGANAPSVFLGALYLLMHRHAAERDQVVAMISNGRPRELPRVDEVIGLFINILLLRFKLDEDESVQTFLLRVRGTVRSAMEHQHYPFTTMLEDRGLAPEEYRRYTSVVFNFLRGEPAMIEAGTGRLEVPLHRPLYGDIGPDIKFQIVNRPGGGVIECMYKTALYDASSVEAYVLEYVELVAQLCEGLDRSVGELSVRNTNGL